MLAFAFFAYALSHQIDLPAEHPRSAFGADILVLPDLDGGGKDDIAVGAPFARGVSGGRPGCVFVYSGETRAELARWAAPKGEPTCRFGSRLALLGDVDGDGASDVMVATLAGAAVDDPAKARTDVWSSRAGRRLFSIAAPFEQIVLLGDVNSDGAADVLATDRQPWRVLSGIDGLEIAAVEAPTEARFLGVRDLNGDGLIDGVTSDGRQMLVSNVDDGGGLSFDVESIDLAPDGHFIQSVAVQLDGMGRPQIAVTTHTTEPSRSLGVFRMDADGVREDARLPVPEPDSLLGDGSVKGVVAGDLDGDGASDLVVLGYPKFDFVASVTAVSRKSGKEIWRRSVPQSGSDSGVRVLPYGHPGGLPDLLVAIRPSFAHGATHALGSVSLLAARTGEVRWAISEERTTLEQRFTSATLWKHRLLLLHGSGEACAEQLRLLSKDLEGAEERKLVALEITEAGDVRERIGSVGIEVSAEFLRDRFAMNKLPFELTLVGLDGDAKHYEFSPVEPPVIWRVIDAMPMRKSETRRR